MEEYSDKQYDDDLTIGSEEYDDSYYTGAEELFEVPTDLESPISRLKSLILSIDWEITDEVLLLFNEELVSLRDTWADNKINLVYVQALEKISKYIYYKKAESHPSAIKLLLTLYHNLEKIVSSADLTEEQKKELLFEDVKRFEQLKAHIKKEGLETPREATAEKEEAPVESAGDVEELRNLKAIVLGIDWEITDEDLNGLQEEVTRLETVFSGNKPLLILLQGIGTLGAYIKLKKSDAHAEAFKVLHLFFESLEKIVSTTMSLDEEKAILFPAVERFNSFKTLIGSTIAPETYVEEEELETEFEEEPAGEGEIIRPAFADIPEDDVHGFQADEEAHALGYDSPEDVVSHVADFFPDEVPAEPQAPDIGETPPDVQESPAAVSLEDEGIATAPAVSADEALAGIDVEEDEEEVEKGEKVATPAPDFSGVDANFALQGVDVETEADDDSDEEGLPQIDGKLAPALSVSAEEVLDEPSDEAEEDVSLADGEDVEGAVADFFGELDEKVEAAADEVKPLEAADVKESKVTEEEGIKDEKDQVELKEDLEKPSEEIVEDTVDADEDVDGVVAGFFDDEEATDLKVEDEEATDLKVEEELEPEPGSPAEMADRAFGDQPPLSSVDRETALQGVDVETEADDETGEEPLPTLGEGVAPALAFGEDEELETLEAEEEKPVEGDEAGVFETVDDFFADELDADTGLEVEMPAEEEPLASDDSLEVEMPVEEEPLVSDDSLEVEMPVEEDRLASDEGLEADMSVVEEREVPDEGMEFETLLEDEPATIVEEAEEQEESEDISAFVDKLDSFFDEEAPEGEPELDAALTPGVAAGAEDLEDDGVFAALSKLDEVEEDEEEEVVFELVEDYVLESSEIATLQDYVDLLGRDVDETILMELSGEIDKLNEKCLRSPMELKLLKLVSTIAEKYGEVLIKRE